ncbi:hypothetical protein ACIBG5_33950 [Kribbella sp. NPDC050241]|uniref:hypothetical protein n=1 Tax=Kribbella sp. NPDC050241 TaxID=3364115 RepID=UPI0037B063E7
MTEVIRPVEPEGIETTMSRTDPARSTLARYVKVVVPFEAAVAVMVTLAPAASADRTTNNVADATTTTTTADAISLRNM